MLFSSSSLNVYFALTLMYVDQRGIRRIKNVFNVCVRVCLRVCLHAYVRVRAYIFVYVCVCVLFLLPVNALVCMEMNICNT